MRFTETLSGANALMNWNKTYLVKGASAGHGL
jgi:hypothetical protein